MADWYGSARSNYFRVNDPTLFREEMNKLGIAIWTHTDDRQRQESLVDERLAIYPDDSDKGGWPTYVCDEQTDEYVEVDLPATLSRHLADGEVAVLVECGAEKLRYITGWAVAVNSKGETRRVTLDDIYDLADELGEHITEASY